LEESLTESLELNLGAEVRGSNHHTNKLEYRGQVTFVKLDITTSSHVVIRYATTSRYMRIC
jgi:hypothetical protein